jgi:hypothetical protein
MPLKKKGKLTAVEGVIAMMKEDGIRPLDDWSQDNKRILYKATMKYLDSLSKVSLSKVKKECDEYGVEEEGDEYGVEEGDEDDIIVRRIIYGVANKLGINEFHEEQFHRIFGDDVQYSDKERIK